MLEKDLEIEIVGRAVKTVPQWYDAKYAPHRHSFTINRRQVDYCTLQPINSGQLQAFQEYVQSQLDKWYKIAIDAGSPGVMELFQEHMALEWLGQHGRKVDWRALLGYFHELHYRTYENYPIILNLVISDGVGTTRITEPSLQKLIDPLASSKHVFIRIDKDLRLMGYEEISWDSTEETQTQTQSYKFSPEFLKPFASTLRQDEFSVHQTVRGDFIVMNSEGLLASKRKGYWHFYDKTGLSRCVRMLLNQTRHKPGERNRKRQNQVGANIPEIIFDLSFKRHGALIVYDPDEKVIKNVNRESILNSMGSDFRQEIGQCINEISIGDKENLSRMKRRFVEIASMDGAVVFNANRVLSFGSRITPYPKVGDEHHGTRTVAAYSAYYWGGVPFKISSDGDISIIFNSSDGSRSHHALLDLF